MNVPNTTFDFYLSPHSPPADQPDLAGIPCNLQGDFEQGGDAEANLRWTHRLTCDASVPVRDSFPNPPVNHVYIPNRDHTRFDVIYVETVRRGRAGSFKRVYLERKEAKWPTVEL